MDWIFEYVICVIWNVNYFLPGVEVNRGGGWKLLDYTMWRWSSVSLGLKSDQTVCKICELMSVGHSPQKSLNSISFSGRVSCQWPKRWGCFIFQCSAGDVKMSQWELQILWEKVVCTLGLGENDIGTLKFNCNCTLYIVHCTLYIVHCAHCIHCIYCAHCIHVIVHCAH